VKKERNEKLSYISFHLRDMLKNNMLETVAKCCSFIRLFQRGVVSGEVLALAGTEIPGGRVYLMINCHIAVNPFWE